MRTKLSLRAFLVYCSAMLLCTRILYAQPLQLHGIVNEGNINVRTDSTVQSYKLGYLKKGEEVQIIERNFEWYKIILPKRFSCYAYAEYLSELDRHHVTVTTAVLRLRNKPSLDAYIIGKVKRGDTLEVVKKNKEWVKVKGFPYTHGWVHKKFVAFQKSAPTEFTESDAATHARGSGEDSTATLTGVLRKLRPLQNCAANCKLESGRISFLLRIEDPAIIEDFIESEITIRGKRLYGGCVYIDVREITRDK